MQQRYPIDPDRVKTFTTKELREHFLIEELFIEDTINMVYSHLDRVIIGGAIPKNALRLNGDKEALASDVFLARREIGIINIGAPGQINVDGTTYAMDKQDGLYIGMGAKDVTFESKGVDNLAQYYFVSSPAHVTHPTTHIPIADATPIHSGDISNSNKRTIYKYVHPDGVQSSQLTMGMTLLAPNNMWNTMPAHLHERRMEAYFYFDIADDNVVFHLMGEPEETRQLVMRNKQAVLSPPWSVHSGMGTGNYTFIWAMAGENQDFTDMDIVSMGDLL